MKKFVLFSFMLASTSVFAALSKWVDENGQVHYSDTPPANAAGVKKLRSSSNTDSSTSPSGTSSNTPTAPKTFAEREAELKKTQQEKKAVAEKAEKEKQYNEALKANCDAAQQRLRVLQDGIRVMEIDANGERSYMNDERRQQNIANAQKDVSNSCK